MAEDLGSARRGDRLGRAPPRPRARVRPPRLGHVHHPGDPRRPHQPVACLTTSSPSRSPSSSSTRHRVSLVNQREVGEDTATFERGLRYALRQDPDVLVAGELPDVETHPSGTGRRRDRASGAGHAPHHRRRPDDRAHRRHLPGRPAAAGPHAAGHHASRDRRAAARPRPRRRGGAGHRGAAARRPRSSSASASATPPTWPRPSSVVRRAAWAPWTNRWPSSSRTGIVDVDVAVERAVDPNELRYLLSGDAR